MQNWSWRNESSRARERARTRGDIACAGAEVQDPDEELEIRVEQWLQDSEPPRILLFKPEPKAVGPQYYPLRNDVNQRADLIQENEVSTPDVLYHPDFVDWTLVRIREDDQVDNPSPNVFQVLDEATESISNLLKSPFCVT